MPAPRGLMVFPGIEQIERGTFPLTQGVTPSVCIIEIKPQDPSEIPLDSDLTILFGDQQPIVFRNCRIDRASFEYGRDGQVWRLSILDRRWRWQFAGLSGPVSGWWNQRFQNIQPPQWNGQLTYVPLGSVNPDTLMSPQQLAAMLLDAMGEQNYDVSALPDNSLPEAVWDNDNPAQLLQHLCDSLGSRVTLGLDDIVRIVQHGIGADLPTDGIERENDVLDPPEIPESIIVVGGRSRYQADFLLEPVGLDTDGTIKPIGELSYAPAPKAKLGGWDKVYDLDPEVGYQEIKGWEQEDVFPPNTPPRIVNAWKVGGLADTVNPRYLARQSVWRWYRISTYWNSTSQAASADDAQQPPLIPGWGVPLGSGPAQKQPAQKQPNNKGRKQGKNAPNAAPKNQWGLRLNALWQILPIQDQQILGWYDNQNNWVTYPAYVYGKYWSPEWDGLLGAANPKQDANYNFTSFVPVVCNYEFDREKGIVRFEDPIVFFDAPNKVWKIPKLYLRCTVSPRYFATSAPDRFYYGRDLTDQGGTPGAGPRVLKREEIVRCVVAEYDAGFGVSKLINNDDAIIKDANYAIDAALLEYQTKTPTDITYMGIVPIAVDGAIQQVVWSVGPEGATTRAARDTEVLFSVPSYRERALMANIPHQTQQVRALQQQARKQ